MPLADQQSGRPGLLLLRERTSQRIALLLGARAHRISLGRSAAQPGGCVSPSIPFASSIETPAPPQDALRQALRNVARSDESAEERSGLMLQDIVPTELASYRVQLQYQREAHASGYSELK
jgi:hypothetical protein